MTFDFWNTLVRLGEVDPHQRRDALVDALAGVGVAADPAAVGAGLSYARERFDRQWRANRQYLLADAIGDLLTVLDVEVEPHLTEALRERWLAEGRSAPVSLAEESVPDVLAELSERGLTFAIVCDAGLMPGSVLRGHLQRLGIAGFFAHTSFSDEVGVYKPAAGIFEHAFAGLGVATAQAVHVGDLHRTDVVGAQAAGARAVRYRGVVDDPEAPSHHDAPLIDSLRELLDE